MSYHVRILAGRVDRSAGSTLYHQELVRRLAARGHRVSLVCHASVPEVADCAEVHEVPKPQAARPFVWRFTSVLDHRHCSRGLARLGLPEADVVIGGEHLFLKAHHRLFPHTPWIYLPHALLVEQELDSYGLSPLMHEVSHWLYVGLQRWALRHADRTLRFTQMGCDALVKRYGPGARFVVNPVGLDLPAWTERPPVGDTPRLLCVGQLIPRKRVDVALRALAGLKQFAWHLDVVGDGALRPDLERLAGELGLADRVRFHGQQRDTGRWYREADLLLFPSWSESLGLVMLEAMSHGVPCLAMRGDGVRFHTVSAEVIRDGVDGFLAESDDDFGCQLEQLLRRPEALRSAGEAAREEVAGRSSWDRHLDRYEELFEELLAERAGRRGARQAVLSTEY
jgi:glycosyltransferase involved in cell wall biosynthesis